MSAPSPEVTGPFCRVPWQQFSRSPRHPLPAHLCRFWYGPLDTTSLEAFLGSRPRHFATRISAFASPSRPVFRYRISLVSDCCAWPSIHSEGCLLRLRHSFASYRAGAGFSACFPSATPLGLALGPDLPRADEPSPGILGLSVCRILTYISLLTPAFSLPCCPYPLAIILLPACNAPLPYTLSGYIRSFGIRLSPGTFSAQGHSTSELLRTLQRMAASEPTS